MTGSMFFEPLFNRKTLSYHLSTASSFAAVYNRTIRRYVEQLVSIRKLWTDTAPFSDEKRAIFSEVKEIKHLHGGVAVHAAPASVRIDAEIGEKGRFRMKTS
jgi:hypothetical protein